MRRLAGHPRHGAIRLAVLAVMTGFVGFWGQGQLSMVTPLATLRTAIGGGSFAYLLYDPFSLVDPGEFAAPGGPWQIGVQDPTAGLLAARRLTDMAIATLSPLVTRLAGGAHILHPGGGGPLWSSVTVETDSAALADGLYTALVLAPRDRIAALAAALPGVARITLVDAAGDLTTL